GDEPGPRPEPHIVVRRQPARSHGAAGEPAGAAGRQVVDVADVLPTAPDRGRRMLLVALDEAEALAEEGGAAGGVQDPAAGHGLGPGPLLISPLEGHAVVELAELDVADPGRPGELRPFGDRGRQEVLVEHVTPEL